MIELSFPASGTDPYAVGIDREIHVTMFAPHFDQEVGAWACRFLIKGPAGDRNGELFGETPLQSIELVAQTINKLYPQRAI
jgi:hypothetical protein